VTKSGEIRRLQAAAGLLSALLVMLGVGAQISFAQDPAAGLARAEGHVAKYESQLPAQQQRVSAAEARYRAAARHAAPAAHALRQSQAEVTRVRRDLAAEERKAKAHIAAAQNQHQQEVDDHDEQVHSGVGFGLAALVAGLIALGWGFFRASASVAALTELELSRAVGLCVGGGMLMLIVGVALGSSNGAVGTLGSFIACLGLILPTAFLLARHSAEVQRGRAKPLLRRERLPNWVPLAIAGSMGVFFLGSTGSAIFAPGASSKPLSPQLQEEAEGPRGQSGADELEAAQEGVAKAKQRAEAPLKRRNRAQRQLASSRGELHRIQTRLTAARSSERSFTQRLVALEEKEQRQLEKEEEQALHEQEEQEEIEAEEAEEYEEELASECDPNYSGCLDPYSPDYDCLGGSGDGPDYTGTVEVLGEDHYGLDANNNGIGCESE
jgi:hypothetical protein